jgi:hypothetical protein
MIQPGPHLQRAGAGEGPSKEEEARYRLGYPGLQREDFRGAAEAFEGCLKYQITPGESRRVNWTSHDHCRHSISCELPCILMERMVSPVGRWDD